MALTERYVSSTGTDTYANSTNSATPMSLTTAFANAAAGDRINIKADGTYTRSASDTAINAGTTTSPIIYRGYSSTIGDGNLGRTNANGALITTNMPLIAYNATFKLTTLASTILESLNFTISVNGAGLSPGASNGIKSCKVDNASTGASATAFTLGGVVIFRDCDISLSSANAAAIGVSCGGNVGRLLGNRITGGIGIQTSSGHIIAFGNVIFATVNHLKATAASGIITAESNTLVGASSTGILMVTSSTAIHSIGNNMITDNGGYGIDFVSAAGAALLAYNRYRDNTSGHINLGTDWVAATDYAKVTTDTGGPETDYVNSASNDYGLITGSPAKAAGWFPYFDIGALQRQEPAGGVFNPLAQSIITVL